MKLETSNPPKRGKLPMWPYKVYVFLAFWENLGGEVSRILDTGVLCVHIERFARKIQTSGEKVREALQDLKDWNLLIELQLKKSVAIVVLRYPDGSYNAK